MEKNSFKVRVLGLGIIFFSLNVAFVLPGETQGRITYIPPRQKNEKPKRTYSGANRARTSRNFSRITTTAWASNLPRRTETTFSRQVCGIMIRSLVDDQLNYDRGKVTDKRLLKLIQLIKTNVVIY